MTRSGLKSNRPTRDSQQATKLYEPNEREKPALDAHAARKAARPSWPAFKTEMHKGKNGSKPQCDLSIDHPDLETGLILQAEAIKAGSLAFYNGLAGHLVNLASKGDLIDEGRLNYAFALVAGIEPRDQLESMLAAQMAAVHMATMTFARQLQGVETISQQDSAERTFNKLARTFAAQMEALKRYRTGGEQKMTVEHVHVHEGGQAIVGNVSHGGQDDGKN